MSIKKDFSAPLASGLGATRRAAMLLLVMMLTTTMAWAQDGSCGEGLRWELTQHEYDTFYTLTISGTGAMYDYDDPFDRPWSSYAEQINEVVIGNGVTSIGYNAFYECTSLASVTFAEDSQLKSIGESAFNSCYYMTSITIPASVTSIGESAFFSCGGLTSVSFAEGSQLKSIGNNAFRLCSNLTSITIPASVTSIGSYVFQNCNLASMTVADGNTVYDSRNGCNAIIETLTDKLIIGCKNSTIPASVTSIGAWAFNGTDLTSIEIPASVTSIGARAFFSTTLTSIEIPASVTSIGDYAFQGCPSLATVTVYAPSCTLGEDAFAYCDNLAYIYVFSDLVDNYKAAWSAYAGNITALPTITTSYVDATGTLHENVEAIPLNNAMTTLPAGTYVVNSDVTYTGTVTLSGDVTLILADGCTMSFGTEGDRLDGTIIECQNHNLTIYGQSGGTGWLKAYSAQYDGIKNVYYTQYSGNVVIFDGNGACINAREFTILGGTLDLKSEGGAKGEIVTRGDINILGGKLWARVRGLKTMSGKIILDYTNATDEIYAYSYQPQNGLQIADGKTLVDDYGKIWSGALNKSGNSYKINNRTLRPFKTITLADNADNSSTISEWNGGVADVTLSGRTLYKNGTWNTLCLPFDVSADQIAAHADFAGATLMTMDVTKENGFDTTDGTLHLWFKTATAIEAGVPYLVKWEKAADYDNNPSAYDISNPVFEGVNVSSTEAQTVESETTGLESVQMVGFFSPVSLTANDKSTLYMGGANTLYYPTVDLLIGSCRAFFSIPYINGHAGARVSAITLNFGEDVVTTSIHNSQFTITTPPLGGWGAYYSLDGRKLSGKPTQRGMYINKGKKILVK